MNEPSDSSMPDDFLSTVFREVSDALSSLMGAEISIASEEIRSFGENGFGPLLSGLPSSILAIRVNVHKGVWGTVLMIVDRDGARRMTERLLRVSGVYFDEAVGDMGQNIQDSAMLEIANIVASKFSSRLSDCLDISVSISTPELIGNRPMTVASEMDQSLPGELKPLMVPVRLLVEDVDVELSIFFIIDRDSFTGIAGKFA